MTTKVPISSAKHIAEVYEYDQVVIVARKVGGPEHVTTYGVDQTHRAVAARIGHFFKHKLMGWPEEQPRRNFEEAENAAQAFVDEYEYDSGESAPHTPDKFARHVIMDCVMGLLVDDEFVAALAATPKAEPLPESFVRNCRVNLADGDGPLFIPATVDGKDVVLARLDGYDIRKLTPTERALCDVAIAAYAECADSRYAELAMKHALLAAVLSLPKAEKAAPVLELSDEQLDSIAQNDAWSATAALMYAGDLKPPQFRDAVRALMRAAIAACPVAVAGAAPDAWLFSMRKPGRRSTLASVGETGSESWPWDEWAEVKREPLVVAGKAEILWPRKEEPAS